MFRSVRSRLTFLFVVLSALLLTIFCGSLYFWVLRALERDLDQQVALHLGIFRDRVAEDHRAVLEERSSPSWVPGDSLATVTDSDGRLLYSSHATPLPTDQERFVVQRDGVDYRGRATRIQTPEGEWTIVLASSEEEMRRELREIRLYFAVFLPVLLLLSWVVGFFFVGRALSPVEEIRRQAERISRSNLAERLPEPATKGEFQDLARTFNEMLERLERAFEDMQSFAADVAHELRTPLANLRVELETSLQRPEETSEGLLASFAEEIDRMTRIVTDLLTLAKLDMRQYALRREPVDLAPLLEEVREIWEPVAEAARIQLVLRECASDAVIQGDAVALRRVVMNLVENAIKYNREGGRVSLSLRKQNGHIALEVADSGPGIEKKHLPDLFRRFYRVDKARSRETGGAGLGLAICKSFVEAHEGKIEVRSETGKGTTFTVLLPISR